MGSGNLQCPLLQVRGLAHPGHWNTPLGGIFESFGAVKASPMSAYKLLKSGEAVLLFPGGGREVRKAPLLLFKMRNIDSNDLFVRRRVLRAAYSPSTEGGLFSLVFIKC